MKQITILLILSMFILSCEKITGKLEKPFTIVYKGYANSADDSLKNYIYQDKNGKLENFYDKDIYNLGDTIY